MAMGEHLAQIRIMRSRTAYVHKTDLVFYMQHLQSVEVNYKRVDAVSAGDPGTRIRACIAQECMLHNLVSC